MSDIKLAQVPRFECLLELSKHYPVLNPTAMQAFLNLLRASDEVHRLGNEFFAKHNITKGRFIVLILLSVANRDREGLQTPADLAEMACCTRATMTGLIDSLEKDGLAKREPDPLDRRMMRVALTDAGRAFVQDILPQHFKRVMYMMSGLTEEENRTLSVLLEKIVQRCGAIEPLSRTPISH